MITIKTKMVGDQLTCYYDDKEVIINLGGYNCTVRVADFRCLIYPVEPLVMSNRLPVFQIQSAAGYYIDAVYAYDSIGDSLRNRISVDSFSFNESNHVMNILAVRCYDVHGLPTVMMLRDYINAQSNLPQ